MDLLLELPVLPLASRLQSHPVVVRLLPTWVAVLAAAALGLWRIRAAGSSKSRYPAPAASFAPSSSTAPPELAAPLPELPRLPQTLPEDQRGCAGPSTQSSGVVGECSPMSKTRFMAYYESSYAEDEDDEVLMLKTEADVVDFEVHDACCGAAGAAPWIGGRAFWEDVAMAKKGDLGWYRCQDREVLNGAVVRMWEGGRRNGGRFVARRGKIAW